MLSINHKKKQPARIWQPIINVKIPKAAFAPQTVGGNAAPSPISQVPPDSTTVHKKKKKKSALSNPLVLGGIGVGILVVIILVMKKKQTPLERIQGYAKGVGAALSKSI